MKLAIAAPSASTYSETFIHMQMERLPCILRIHGNKGGNETVPGGPIDPRRSPFGWMDLLRFVKGSDPKGRASLAEVQRRLHRKGVSVVLANYGQTGVALQPVCKALGIGLVVHFHGYDAHQKSVIEKFGKQYRELGHYCDRIVVVSERMLAALAGLGIPKEKLALIRYGIDPATFGLSLERPDYPTFFGVGRFVDKKAPYLTLLAFKEVVKQYPTARLIIAGDGPLLDTVHNLVHAFGLGSQVSLPGPLPHHEVSAHMRHATAFVQHSISPRWGDKAGDSEGTPLAVLEAMMTGLPVIATRHAGIADVIEDGVSGYLIDELDVVEMSRAMIRVVRDSDEAARIGSNARETASAHFTADRYIADLQNVIRAAHR